uniref:Uncharacterized protein n=1 Tax=Tetraodon nigroviridis TaxID=99883 RepID=H3CKQ6_TETNG
KDGGGEEEPEEFDDLTQDEDEEEVMSSASEESVLSVPELQETMKQLTWLAAEQRHGTDGDSEEEQSPTSPGVSRQERVCCQQRTDLEEQGGVLLEGEVRGLTVSSECLCSSPHTGTLVVCVPVGRGPPLRGLRRSRQERHSKDATKLLLLYDDHILDNDPFRESKDVAFAQSYLRRVREALQDDPVQVEDFVSLLHDFEQLGEGQEVMPLFRKLRNILGDQSDLLRDFAAFLYPEQALQCGLFEEQQAFERSRRFLRQLEISFGDNPSHYQKIIKALQTSPDLNPAGIDELKSQMVTLLKGHTHLQAEFWVFFEELHPPTANPGQFEESHWPETSDSLVCRGEAAGGFEEVSLPDLDEEEDGPKIQPMTHRRQRRKMGTRRNYKVRVSITPVTKMSKSCTKLATQETPGLAPDIATKRLKKSSQHFALVTDTSPVGFQAFDRSANSVCFVQGYDWSPKDWPCHCPDARHRRKGCTHCHGNKVGTSFFGNSEVSLTFAPTCAPPPQSSGAVSRAMKGLDPVYSQLACGHSEAGDKDLDVKRDSPRPGSYPTVRQNVFASSLPICLPVSSAPPPPPDPPVCAKNISLTASGEKVILWTREADRVILTRCQQDGANQSTFQAISSLLGNKTPTEVFRRFQDLMGLFRTAARQSSSEEETAPTDVKAAVDED